MLRFVLSVFCLCFGCRVWAHVFGMFDVWCVFGDGFVQIALYTCGVVHSPFGSLACVLGCVLLCVLPLFCLCLGCLVWARGIIMFDGWFAFGAGSVKVVLQTRVVDLPIQGVWCVWCFVLRSVLLLCCICFWLSVVGP